MRLFRFTSFIALYLCISTSAALASTKQTFNQQRSDYEHAFKSENPQFILKYYDNDVRLMPEANPTIFSADHARLYFQTLFERFEIEHYVRTHAETLDMGEQMAEFGFFSLKLIEKSGAKRDLEGKYLNLWRKQDDGTLNIIADIWNFDKITEGFSFSGQLTFSNIPSIVTALGPRVFVDTPLLVELKALSLFNTHAIMTRDKNLISRLNAHDAVLYPNYGKVLSGMDEIKAFWDVHMDRLPPFAFLRNNFDKVDVLENYIVQYSTHIVSWQTGKHSGINTGKHIRILKRESNGSLKTYRRISAYDK